MPAYDYDCAACGRRFEVIHGVYADGPTTCPLCGKGPVRKAITRRRDPLQGLGLGQEGAARHGARRASARRPSTDGSSSDGRQRVVGERQSDDGADGDTPAKKTATDRPRRPPRSRRPTAAPSLRPRLTDDGRRRPTGSPWPRPPTSWPRRTSTSRRPRSAAGLERAGSRASSSAAVGSSGAARSGRSSPHRDGSGSRTSSRSCSRTWAADPGRPMDAARDPRAGPRPAPGGPGHARSSTSTAAPPAGCWRTAWRSRRCSRRSRPRSLVARRRRVRRRRQPGGSGSQLVQALIEAFPPLADLIDGAVDGASARAPR